MKHYIIYKITNLVTDKIYVGMHITDNLNDGYMGSSNPLKDDIRILGLDKFKKEILFEFDNFDDMKNKEREIVNAEFVCRDDTYNLNLGGGHGYYYINKNNLNNNAGQCYKLAAKLLSDPEFRKFFSERIREGQADAIANGWDRRTWLGKRHTDESKKKIGIANSKAQSGKRNSQYGTCWIHNLESKQNKKIKKKDLNEWILNGWIEGRKIKF